VPMDCVPRRIRSRSLDISLARIARSDLHGYL
jgi:hypothetical protein